MRKITFHKTRWSKNSFYTPYIGILRHHGDTPYTRGYIQISFVFINYHFWVIID